MARNSNKDIDYLSVYKTKKKIRDTYSLKVRKNIGRFMELQNLCYAYFTVKKAR